MSRLDDQTERYRGPGRLTVVTAPAEIGVTTAYRLQRVLLAAAACGYDIVVVDLTRSRRCGCAGRGVLVRARQRARVTGGELRLLLSAEGAVPRLFALTDLDRAIPVFASVASASA